MSLNEIPNPVSVAAPEVRSRRQVEHAVAGVPGLRLAIYPSGRRTYIFRHRDPITGRKTSITLGTAD